MRKFIAVLFLLAIAGYFFFKGKTYEVRITEAQLKDAISKKLPFREKYFLIFEVALFNPRFDLVNGSEKINAGLDLEINIFINKDPKPLGGSIDLLTGVRYDEAQGALYLSSPEINKLLVQGVPEKYSKKVSEALELALNEIFSKYPVYKLSKLKSKEIIAKSILKNVIIKNEEVLIIIGY